MEKKILEEGEFDKMLTKLKYVNDFNYLASTGITFVHYFGEECFLT